MRVKPRREQRWKSGAAARLLRASGGAASIEEAIRNVVAELLNGVHCPPTAHEMGHAFFEHTGPRCPRSGTELERLCDMIASEILMPTDVFAEAIGPKLSAQKLMQLSRTFGASLAATTIRCSRFRQIAAFMTDGECVSWSYGLAKVPRVAELDCDLRDAVAATKLGERECGPVFARSGAGGKCWNVDAMRLSAGRKFLFVLTPFGAHISG
ncbi:MAG TPA: ImmA/IrrE family metallo-endopeptidase [Pirellulales bacterium]|nr:ImmA/IrrE family metallo-endopeptidase [Pirellulales bacterium]